MVNVLHAWYDFAIVQEFSFRSRVITATASFLGVLAVVSFVTSRPMEHRAQVVTGNQQQCAVFGHPTSSDLPPPMPDLSTCQKNAAAKGDCIFNLAEHLTCTNSCGGSAHTGFTFPKQPNGVVPVCMKHNFDPFEDGSLVPLTYLLLHEVGHVQQQCGLPVGEKPPGNCCTSEKEALGPMCDALIDDGIILASLKDSCLSAFATESCGTSCGAADKTIEFFLSAMTENPKERPVSCEEVRLNPDPRISKEIASITQKDTCFKIVLIQPKPIPGKPTVLKYDTDFMTKPVIFRIVGGDTPRPNDDFSPFVRDFVPGLTCKTDQNVADKRTIVCKGKIKWDQLPRILQQSPLRAQLASGQESSLPAGEIFTPTLEVTDGSGQKATLDDVDFRVDPLITDVSINTVCTCVEKEEAVCDLHVINNGPDPLPAVLSEVQLQNATHNRDSMPPVIYDVDHVTHLGTGITLPGGQWENNGVVIPPGGKFAAWPLISLTSDSAVRNMRVTTPLSFDPNPENNEQENLLSSECNALVGNPPVICIDDSELYVYAVGRVAQGNAPSVHVEQTLHQCWDPATVSALEPAQFCKQDPANPRKIICRNLPLSQQQPIQMVSFEVDPRANCPIGTSIPHQAFAEFTNTRQSTQKSNTVYTRFCPCDDKRPDCGLPPATPPSCPAECSLKCSTPTGGAHACTQEDRIGCMQCLITKEGTEGGNAELSCNIYQNHNSCICPNGDRLACMQCLTADNVDAEAAEITCNTLCVSDSPPQCDCLCPSSSKSSQSMSGGFSSAFSEFSQFSQFSSRPPITLTFCGNGIIEAGEQCDDGNVNNGDGCSSVCMREPILEIPPRSSASATSISFGSVSSVPFPPSSVPPVSLLCGNLRIDPGEECDDGNTRSFDGCTDRCLSEWGICGDGVVQSLLREQCELSLHDPSLPYECRNCRFFSFFCGDGKIDPGEQCDSGITNADSPNAPCRTDCSFVECGDGILDAGEQCDDRNYRNGDGCSDQCLLESPPWPLGPGSPFFTGQVPSGYFYGLQPYAFDQDGPKKTTDTGPGILAIAIAGAAAGCAWVRRRTRKN